MAPAFIKFHGFGNDYIVIESEELAGFADWGEFAGQICNRHYGAGADGIAVISRENDEGADFSVRIFNPDGSEAGLSGNGTRCAAAYVYYKKLWTRDELRLITRSGIKRYFLVAQAGQGKYVFDSELGQPGFHSDSIPMLTDRPLKKVIDYPLAVDGHLLNVTALQMGNPNCCIFVDDFEALDWRRLGRAIENHKQFPDRTNVVFVRVRDRHTVELRIWERGVGETTASGTCSCAAAVAAMINGKTERSIDVLMPGGRARIQWREDGEVVINAPAELVYAGDWLAHVLPL
ncbi:MAG: diaminopimelate epimerase [Pyrinomonadaceae bacterium]|nr:diaminopimelate epimerase [Pyrinomonadaceae bacterium]